MNELEFMLQTRKEIDEILTEKIPVYFLSYSPLTGIVDGKLVDIRSIPDEKTPSIYVAPKARMNFFMKPETIPYVEKAYDSELIELGKSISDEVVRGIPIDNLHWCFLFEIYHLISHYGVKEITPVLMLHRKPGAYRNILIKMYIHRGLPYMYRVYSKAEIDFLDFDMRTRCYFALPLWEGYFNE